MDRRAMQMQAGIIKVSQSKSRFVVNVKQIHERITQMKIKWINAIR